MSPLNWMLEHPGAVTALGVGTLLVTAMILPVLVARMPSDYFVRDSRQDCQAHYALRLLLRVVKNLLGGVIVLCGVAMLVLPGQGLLTILVGLTLLEFPGKRSLELWVVRRGAVRRGIAWLRTRAGRPPLRYPEEDDAELDA